MKKLKRSLSILLAFVLLASCIPFSGFAAVTDIDTMPSENVSAVYPYDFTVGDLSGWSNKTGGYLTEPNITEDGYLNYKAVASNVIDDNSPQIADGQVSFTWKVDPELEKTNTGNYNSSFGAIVRYIDKDNYVHVQYTANGFALEKPGTWSSSIAAPELVPGSVHRLSISFIGKTVTIYLDGENIGSFTEDWLPTGAGKIGFRNHNATAASSQRTKNVYVKDIAYKDFNAEEIEKPLPFKFAAKNAMPSSGPNWGADGKIHITPSGNSQNFVLEDSPAFTDGSFEFDWTPTADKGTDENINHSMGFLLRYVDEGNYVMAQYQSNGNWLVEGVNTAEYPDAASFWNNTVNSGGVVLETGKEYHIKLSVTGKKISVSIDGGEAFTLTENEKTPTAEGKVGFRKHNSWTPEIVVRNIAITAQGATEPVTVGSNYEAAVTGGLSPDEYYIRNMHKTADQAQAGLTGTLNQEDNTFTFAAEPSPDTEVKAAVQQGLVFNFHPLQDKTELTAYLRYKDTNNFISVRLFNSNGQVAASLGGKTDGADLPQQDIGSGSSAFVPGTKARIRLVLINNELWVYKDADKVAAVKLTDEDLPSYVPGSYGFGNEPTVSGLVFLHYSDAVSKPIDMQPDSITDGNMKVTLNKDFPTVIGYELNGKTMDGQVEGVNMVSIGLLNATPVNSVENYIPRKVDYINNGDNATYKLYIANKDGTGADSGEDDIFLITINYKIENNVLIIDTQSIEEKSDAKLKSISYPGNSLLSVNNPEETESAQLAAYWNSVGSVTDLPPTGSSINSPNAVANYNTQYDCIYDLKNSLDITRVELPYKVRTGGSTTGEWQNDSQGTAISGSPANEVGIAILTNGDLAATIINNRASEKYRFAFEIVKDGADVRLGRFEDGRHYYRHDVSSETLAALGDENINWQLVEDALPLTKVYLGEDQNADGKIDWQDGGILYRHAIAAEKDSTQDDRDMTHMPINNEYIRNSVLYINHNLNHTNSTFYRATDILKKTYNLTDGFGQRAMFKGYQAWGHDDSHPDYGNHFGPLMGGMEGFQKMTEIGKDYNTKFGVHLSGVGAEADAFYFDPRTNDGKNGYKWVDSTPSMYFERDMLSGQLYGRLKELKKNVPELGWIYLDVYYHADWVGKHTMEIYEENDWMVMTEFGGAMPSYVSGNHWGNDIGYPDQGVNISGLRKFIMYNNMESPEPDPLLRGSFFLQLGSWRGHDYKNTVDIFNAVDLPNKYLQHFELMEYDWGNQAVFSNNVKSIKEDNRTIIYGVDGTKIADLPYDLDYRPNQYGTGGSRTYDLTKTAKIFIPWTETVDFEGGMWDETTEFRKAYVYNGTTGSATWDVPAGWSGSVELYELTDTGRKLVDTIAITDGKVSFDLTGGIGYIAFPTNYTVNKIAAAGNWGESSLVPDNSFTSHYFVGEDESGRWNKSSTSGSTGHISMTQDEGNVDYLGIASNSGDATVWQDLTVTADKNYTASIWVQIGGRNNSSMRKTKLIIEDEAGNVLGENYITRNMLPSFITEHQYMSSSGSHRSTMWVHPLKVKFTAPASGKIRFKLEVDATTSAAASVYFNWADLKEFFTEPGYDMTDSKIAYYEDFENMDQNWGSLEKGMNEGQNQSHIAEKYVKGDNKEAWYVPTDDNLMGIKVSVPEAGLQPFNYVIGDRFTLYLHDNTVGEVARTLPQSLRLESGKRYKLSFDYKSYCDVKGTASTTALFEVAIKANAAGQYEDLLREKLPQTYKNYTHAQPEYYVLENEPAPVHKEFEFETKNFSSQEDPLNGDIYLTFNKLVSGETKNLFVDNIVIEEIENFALVSVAQQDISAEGEGTIDAPKTATIDLPHDKADITAATEIAVSGGAEYELYSDAGYNTAVESLELIEGENHLYIKLTNAAADSSLYYDITVNRAAASEEAVLFSVADIAIDSWAGGDGTAADAPKTAKLDVNNSKDAINPEDIKVSEGAALELYSDDQFSQKAENIELEIGVPQVAYIKVTAEDGSIIYYSVEITRSEPSKGYFNNFSEDGSTGAWYDTKSGTGELQTVSIVDSEDAADGKALLLPGKTQNYPIYTTEWPAAKSFTYTARIRSMHESDVTLGLVFRTQDKSAKVEPTGSQWGSLVFCGTKSTSTDGPKNRLFIESSSTWPNLPEDFETKAIQTKEWYVLSMSMSEEGLISVYLDGELIGTEAFNPSEVSPTFLDQLTSPGFFGFRSWGGITQQFEVDWVHIADYSLDTTSAASNIPELEDKAVGPETAVSFSVAEALSSEDGILSYRWQVSTDDGAAWADLAGETKDSLEFTATTAEDGNQYRCQVINTAVNARTKATPTNAVILTVNEKAEQEAPTGLTATAPSSIGAADGSISGVDNTMEYRKQGDENFTAVTGDTIADLAAAVYEVRYAGTDTKNPSPVTELTVPEGSKAEQEAPTGLTATAPSSIGAADGSISGVDNTMEYRKQGDENFTAVTGDTIADLAAAVYEVRYAETDTKNPSPVTELTVPEGSKAEQEAPTGLTATAPSSMGASDGSISGVDNTMEYRKQGDENFTAVTSDTIADLAAAVYEVRYAGTDTKNPSPVTDVTVPEGSKSEQEAPTGLTATAPSFIGAADGSISGVDNTMEYRKQGDENFTAVTGETIADLAAAVYEVRYAGTDTKNPSPVAKLTVPQGNKLNREAPTGLTAAAPSAEGKTDGKIFGVNSNMEYRKLGELSFKDIAGDSINNLSPGVYEVRIKGSSLFNPSPVTSVTVPQPQTPVISYSLSFVTNGGSSIAAVTKPAGTVISLAGYSTTREGYSFMGWYAQAASADKLSTVTLNSDMTVYARWEEIKAKDPIESVTVNKPELDNKGGILSIAIAGPGRANAHVVIVDEDGKEIVSGKTDADGKLTLNLPENSEKTDKKYTVKVKPEGAAEFSNVIAAVTVKAKAETFPFKDVKTSHWFYEDAYYVWEKGLMNGMELDMFGPDGTMTRGMLVTVLGRAAGVDIADYTAASFTDVRQDKYYAPYIKWASENAIVLGIGDKLFAPESNVTREQAALIFNRYAKAMKLTLPTTEPTRAFADISNLGAESKECIQALTRAGVIKGKSDTQFDPRGTAKRSEVAAMIHRFMEATKQ